MWLEHVTVCKKENNLQTIVNSKSRRIMLFAPMLLYYDFLQFRSDDIFLRVKIKVKLRFLKAEIFLYISIFNKEVEDLNSKTYISSFDCIYHASFSLNEA